MHHNHLIIIAPTAPPGVCGVSDYSYLTALELTKVYKSIEIGVEKLPKQGDVNSIPLVSIGAWQNVLKKNRELGRSADVLVNYTPTSYAWSGWPISFILELKRFKQAHSDNRIFILFHETWNGRSDLKFHHRLRDQLTKWSMKQICLIADGISISTNDQMQKIESIAPKSSIWLSRIGAGIVPESEEMGLLTFREKGKWGLFGLSHTRLWTLQAHLPLIKALKDKGIIQQLLSIGPSDDDYARQEIALSNQELGSDVLIQLGALPPKGVSTYLLKIEAAFIGQKVDSLLKSSTFAALAAHAVPVICEVPATLQDPPGDAFFKPSELYDNPEIISSNEGEIRRRKLHTWYWATRSWKAIGKNIMNWIDNPIN